MMGAMKAVVTGGGTGIGLAVTSLLAELGWHVLAIGLERDDNFPENADFAEVDVTNEGALGALLGDIDRLHGLVTCAGIIRYDEEWSPDVFEKVMSVNVTGALVVGRAALPALERAGGAVVNIASMWSWFGNPVAPAYGASKGAVAALTRSQAVSWGARGVRVNAVAPGWVKTRISEGARSDMSRKNKIDVRIPLGRWAETKEIAHVVAFLLSAEAGYVHGAIVPVDGGYHAA